MTTSPPPSAIPRSPRARQLRRRSQLATAVYLALLAQSGRSFSKARRGRQTEIARCWPRRSAGVSYVSNAMRARCPGSAVYEWNYARQMIEIRLAETGQEGRETVEEEIFLRALPDQAAVLQALGPRSAAPRSSSSTNSTAPTRPSRPISSSALGFPGDHPEIGTVKAAEPPIVVVTSNRTREIHDALKRRCFYYWVDYPTPGASSRSSGSRPPRRRGAEPRGRIFRPETAWHRPLQAARRRRRSTGPRR